MSTQITSQPTEKMSTLTSQGFDYATLDAETRLAVQQQTSEIKTLMRRTAQDIINIGQKLIEVKKQLGHGQFRNWLKVEFDWSVRTAARFMQVATQFKSANLAHLEIAASALYLLAEASTPSEAQKEVLELAKQGENIGYAKARDIINQHKKTAMLATSSTSDNVDVLAETVGWTASTPAPTMTLPVESTVKTQSVTTIEQSEDKISGKTTEAPEHFQISNPSDIIAHDKDSNYYLSKEQTDYEIRALSLVGDLIYITDQEQQESKLLGEITEVKEVTATEMVIKISRPKLK